MTTDILSNKGTGWNYAISLIPRIVQRRLDQLCSHAPSFQSLRYFSVRECNSMTAHSILRNCHRIANLKFETVFLRIVVYWTLLFRAHSKLEWYLCQKTQV